MKITFIGAGAHRHAGIIRSMLATPGLLENGEIILYDLNTERARRMEEFLRVTPEYHLCPCRIHSNLNLDEALEGADVVTVVLMAMPQELFMASDAPSLERGFLSSDNLSVTGAFLAAYGVPIVLDIARRMERLCPAAWLLDFANPVAVLSGAVNRHTHIRSLGVCAGYTNHLWDLPRIFGRDEQLNGFDGECAGVNHMSFITRGMFDGEELFSALEKRFADHWQPPVFHSYWPEDAVRAMILGLRRNKKIYEHYKALIFSSEFDGMANLFYDEALAEQRAHRAKSSSIEERMQHHAADRAAGERQFLACIQNGNEPAFWEENRDNLLIRRCDQDIFVQLVAAIGGSHPARVAASLPNHGAIEGIAYDHIVEYTFNLYKNELKPCGSYHLPPSVHGLVADFAAHQTLLADALALQDPSLFVQAIMSYPVGRFSSPLAELGAELCALHKNKLPNLLNEAETRFRKI